MARRTSPVPKYFADERERDYWHMAQDIAFRAGVAHQHAQRAVNPAFDALKAMDGVAPGRAVRAPTRGEETIQGRWKLIAAEDLRADGSVARYPWGSRPVGSIVVEGGSCYLQIMSGDQ